MQPIINAHFLACVFIIITNTYAGSLEEQGLVHQVQKIHHSLKCNWTQQLTFRKAHILGGDKKFWWVDGRSDKDFGKGESYEDVQKWFDTVERSSMTALDRVFSALESPDKYTFLDIGSHQGWFSQVAGAYGLRAIGFDMQRMCVELYKCSSAINGFWNHKIVNAYVTNSTIADKKSLLQVSNKMCTGGTSVSNTGSDSIEIIRPLDIGAYLVSQSPPLDIPMIKIDTEGYETIILGGIISVPVEYFSRIANFIIEVTPGRWEEFGVSQDEGFRVFQELFEKGFQARILYDNHNRPSPAQAHRWHSIILKSTLFSYFNAVILLKIIYF